MLITKYFYFFKTVTEAGIPRLKPLSGQYTPQGDAIDPTYNVQSDRIMRESYPMGTVFGSDTIELRTHSSTPFYSTGAIYPMGLPLGSYIVHSHIPSKDMSEAFDNLMAHKVSNSGPGLFTSSGEAATIPETVSANEPKQAETTPKNFLDTLKSDKSCNKPTISSDGFYITNANWYLLVRNIKQKINTMMIGPSGTGKTELIMLACKKLGIDCSVYDMGSMYDPVAGLLGVHRLQKGGESVFDYAKFTQDIQKPGVVLLDELSRAPVTTNNILFPCLDSRRMLPVEMAGGENIRSIQVHPDCVFVATANIGAEYTGTMSLDRALVGRFFPLELEYMPCTEEARVLTNRFKIGQSDAANIVAVAETVRSLYDKGDISCSISTRETIQAAQLVADGWSALEAMELVYLPLFEGTRSEGERSVVAKIFMTR